uniref:Uncharacterized protein n=1 Tax=Setaria viridis TaxID=4556 RepID=A0A4U6W4X4_SETVI|nr:hypothetical protein SEVIR_1G029380v2 [Setaria viridis]
MFHHLSVFCLATFCSGLWICSSCEHSAWPLSV